MKNKENNTEVRKDIKVRKTYFSFGHGHKHLIQTLIGDEEISHILGVNTLLCVKGDDPRGTMFKLFGDKWSFQYDKIPDMHFFPLGIYELPDLEFIIETTFLE